MKMESLKFEQVVSPCTKLSEVTNKIIQLLKLVCKGCLLDSQLRFKKR